MILSRQEEDCFIIDFVELESWESFEIIVEILQRKFGIKVIERKEGPESRVWDLEIEGYPVSLHNNPYGNYLKVVIPTAIHFIKEEMHVLKALFL